VVAAREAVWLNRHLMSTDTDRIKELEAALSAAKEDCQAARAEVQALLRILVTLEKERDDARAQLKADEPASERPSATELDEVVKRIADLRELLSTASKQLSELHAAEVEFSVKRARILGDTCALLARAVGETGSGGPPPPLPSTALEAKLDYKPVVDISEVAQLIDSLRPPPPSR
jgi:hypothetical protein